MRNYLTIAFLLISALAFGQSESHNMTTYDTTISYRGASPGGHNWRIIITRPVNFFTPGNADTASRPVIMTMQGDGEIANGVDTFYNNYGPHWQLAHAGWDGSVVLGNGTHYPILITVIQDIVNTRPWNFQSLFDTLYKEFHPRSVHYAGLSGGVEVGGWLLTYQSTLGDEHVMARIQSFTNLSGVAPSFPVGEGFQGAQPLAYPEVWGYWAHKYHGRYWSTLGNTDNQTSTYLMEQMINDSVPGAAYFSWVNIDGGAHGGWNTQYDPTQLNWTNQGTFGNSYIATNGGAANTAGNYSYNPTTGESWIQWALRQGDTTLVNPAPAGDTSITIGSGEYATMILEDSTWYGLGDIHFIGNGFTGTSGLPYPVSVTAGTKFVHVDGALHGGAAIDSHGYPWTVGENTHAQLGNGGTAVSYVGNQVSVDSSGNVFDSVVHLASYYVQNNAQEAGQGYYAIKSTGTLWTWGSGSFGMRGNGTVGSADSFITRPVQVPIPGGRSAMQVVGGQHMLVLMTDGTVWGVGMAASPNDYGYTMTGTQYASLQQIVDSAGNPLTGIIYIAGAMSYNYALANSGTKLWAWGNYGNYMGGLASGADPVGGGVPIVKAHDVTDSTIGLIGDTITQIITNQNATYALTKHGKAYGWGDNAQAAIGNGIELDYFHTTAPFAWDFNPGDLLVKHPSRITGDSDIVAIYCGNQYGFNAWAKEKDPITGTVRLLAWGRDKGGILCFGHVPCSSAQSGLYPNASDKKWPTISSPLTLTTLIYLSCPVCAVSPLDSNCSNSGCSIPTTTITPSAGSNQTLSGGTTSTVLNGTASTSTGTILSNAWTEVSGPTTATFNLHSITQPTIGNLTTGTYTLKNIVTDNSRLSDSATMTVTVGSATPPTVSAGSNQTITLPTATVTLAGSATAISPATSITTYAWTQTSGPNTGTFSSTSIAAPTFSALIAGTYVLKLTVTDNNGNTNNASVTITVNPVPVTSPGCLVNKNVNVI